VSQITVVYVAGAGRSGSTVFDTVLGSSVGAIGVGELVNAPNVLSSENEYCACGVRAIKCQFWKDVQKEWWRQATPFSLAETRRIQRKFELRRNYLSLLISQLRHTNYYRQYLQNTGSLYRAIAQVSRKRVIIDSSKSPVRAAALAGNSALNFCVVHLIRDGRGVAWSLAKACRKNEKAGVQNNLEAKPIWRTALYWVLTNALTEIVLRPVLGKKYVRVNYDEFVRNPDKVLAEVSRVAEHDFVGDGEELRRGMSVTVGHTIAGNRVRMQRTIKLKEDKSWKKSLSSRDRIIFWLIAGLMLRRYGYQKSY